MPLRFGRRRTEPERGVIDDCQPRLFLRLPISEQVLGEPLFCELDNGIGRVEDRLG